MTINYLILLFSFVPVSYYIRPIFRLSPLLTIFFIIILSACGDNQGVVIEEEGNVIEIKSISLNLSNDIIMEAGETKNITVILSLTNGNYYEAVLESDNPGIVTITGNVSNSATLTAVSGGTAIITATAKDKSAKLTVLVYPKPLKNLRQVSFDKTAEVELAWDASLGAKNYEVSWVKDDKSTNLVASPATVTYTVTGLDANTYYGYEVKACAGSLCSSPSFVLAVTRPSGNSLSDIVASEEIPADLNNYDEPSRAIFGGYAANAPVIFRYVLPGGSGDNSGSAWSNAADSLKTVLDGINDAAANKVYSVLVGPGVYQAGSEMSMKNYVSIVGGVSRNNNLPVNAFTIGPTVLSGEGSDRVFNNNYTAQNLLTSTARLYGVTITKGYVAGGQGGGMYNNNASPVLTRVTFYSNRAVNGGGMYNTNAYPVLTGVTFFSNRADYGGGMINISSTPALNKVVFMGNTGVSGRGMYNGNNSFPVLVGAVFVHKSDTIANDRGSSITAVNSIFQASETGLQGNNIHYSILTGVTTNNNQALNPITFSASKVNGISVPILENSLNIEKNTGIHVKRSGRTHYYSLDNSNWYTSPALTTSVILPTDAIDLTAFDMTGYPVTDRPDIGVVEVRQP